MSSLITIRWEKEPPSLAENAEELGGIMSEECVDPSSLTVFWKLCGFAYSLWCRCGRCEAKSLDLIDELLCCRLTGTEAECVMAVVFDPPQSTTAVDEFFLLWATLAFEVGTLFSTMAP